MGPNWSEIVDRAMSSRPQLELPRNFKLPCLPQSVVEFSAVSKDPEAGPRELAAPIEADAALTSGLLRQANSMASGVRQPISSVKQAINLLGPRRTKTLVLTSALQSATAAITSRLINLAQLQKTNRTRAEFARCMALGMQLDPEVAYFAGLLQDFMLPLLSEAFYDDYNQILQPEINLVEEEERRFGWNHAQVGAMVMHDWGFPPEMVACVLMHHQEQQVLSDPSLCESCVGTSVAAGCLPVGRWESPTSFETLLAMQNEMSNFSFLYVAVEVDQEILGIDIDQHHVDGLHERLSSLAEATLEKRRIDRVHQNRQIGSYVLESQIGKGAMGVIYVARHCMLNRRAAIKLLQTSQVSPAALAMFQTEAQLTCQLTSPHTVSVYDYGVTPEGLFYYAMEFLDGVTLAELVRTTGPLPANRVIHFLTQACASLVEAHTLKLIHRDLKPENMMVCNRGGVPDTLKVLDFGVATMMTKTPGSDHGPMSICGTPYYMSPEAIIAPQTQGIQSDLYSLGAVGYYLLTGKTLFSSTDINLVLKSQLTNKPLSPSTVLGRPVDADLEAVLLQCLEKLPEARPANAEELSRKLNQCVAAGTWNPFDAVPATLSCSTEEPAETVECNSTIVMPVPA